jgi:hypothetical protein
VQLEWCNSMHFSSRWCKCLVVQLECGNGMRFSGR